MTTVPSSREDQPNIWMCLLPALLAWAWLVVKASKMWTAMPDLSFGWLVPILCGFPSGRFGKTSLPLFVVGGGAVVW